MKKMIIIVIAILLLSSLVLADYFEGYASYRDMGDNQNWINFSVYDGTGYIYWEWYNNDTGLLEDSAHTNGSHMILNITEDYIFYCSNESLEEYPSYQFYIVYERGTEHLIGDFAYMTDVGCVEAYMYNFPPSYVMYDYSIDFTQPIIEPEQASSSPGKTRYIVDANGNIIGVMYGNQITYFEEQPKEQAATLAVLPMPDTGIKQFFMDLWAKIKSIFGG